MGKRGIEYDEKSRERVVSTKKEAIIKAYGQTTECDFIVFGLLSLLQSGRGLGRAERTKLSQGGG